MVTTGYTQAERARALAEYLGHAERIGRAAIHDGPPMTNESMQQRHNAAIQDMKEVVEVTGYEDLFCCYCRCIMWRPIEWYGRLYCSQKCIDAYRKARREKQ